MQTSVAVALGLTFALVACEGTGHLVKRGWPTVESAVAWTLARPAGRVALLIAWLWLGWHLFVR